MSHSFFHLDDHDAVRVLRLQSPDGTNRLSRECVVALRAILETMSADAKPLVITGNAKFFSAGAELNEIAVLDALSAYEFAKLGQALMLAVERFPAPVFAAVLGYCMGGGLDLALACHRRFAAPNAVFGHRGAALGLITGWGGTQRLPRIVGKGIALELFVAAEKIGAHRALAVGLVNSIVEDPVAEALREAKLQRTAGSSLDLRPCSE